MITCKVSDYFTISVLPAKSEVTIDQLLRQALVTLYLDELFDKGFFEFMCSTQYYEAVYRFSDIQIKIPYESNFVKTGICFEFSGKGVDYYREYLATHYIKVDLRFAFRRFVALSDLGYKTTASRFDVSFDEIIKTGEQVEPYLDLDRIQSALKSGAFVSTFRKSDATSESGEVKSIFKVDPDKIDDSLPYRFIESVDLSSGRIGKTIELGRRKSSSFLRFYDKLVEQSVHGEDVSGIASWVRCEIELKHNNACSAFLMYALSEDDTDFSNKIRGKIFSLIRFVELDHTRTYNCTVCDWWVGFLNHVKPYNFEYKTPKHNKYIRALEHQKCRNAASLAALVTCCRGSFKSIIVDGFKNPTKTSQSIIQDYNAIKSLSDSEFLEYYDKDLEQKDGFDFWRQYAPGFSDEAFKARFSAFVEHLCADFDKAIDEVLSVGV